MKNVIALTLAFLLGSFAAFADSPAPLRIFIRAGPKTHGPGMHDGPSFLRDWKPLLTQRGCKVDGAIGFPTAEQLANTDVVVMYAQNAGSIPPAQRAYLDTFLKRGGGIVVIHDAIASDDPDWFKTIVGGAWAYGRAGYFEGDISFYYLDHTSPITRDASNFDFDDEMYYHLDMMPEAHILAGTYTPDERNKHDGRIYPSVYDVSPQMWTYETNNHRAFVCIPGHMYKSFSLPHFRAVLLRGIAWAGKRDPDLLVTKEELASLTYPEGGPTRPEEAAKKISLAPGFNISLVASEPLIEKPISMDWDPKGRLWIAETPEYPFRHDRSRAPYDRISILEDTKHTGRMDKKTVFYDGLDLVTSMAFYKDGVIVSQAPDIYWLRDTKGKGHADEKILLYQGFGTFDTHAVVNNLRWGLDGWIYATLGYTKGDIYSADRKTHFGRLSEGVIRFKPDGSAIEQVSSKGGNTWGVDIAPDGEIFYSQANGNHIDHVVMPESVLARGRVGNTTSYLNIEDHNRSYPMMSWTKQAYVQIDWVGNFTAAAGACIYDGGAWPDKYNYNYFVSEPTINIVHQDILTPKGVSYVASKDPDRLEKEFVASSDLWFRPIHQRVGPDGALYVLDFYNQAVVHNDTRGPRHDPQSNEAIRPDRDHHFGRIWRIQHDDAKKLDIPHLDRAKPAELVKALEHPNEWVRATALRLLRERHEMGAVPALEDLAQSEKASAYARIHALWALSDPGLGMREQSLLTAMLNSGAVEIRKAALDVVATSPGQSDISRTNAGIDWLGAMILARLNDSDARIRLKALIALQTAPLNYQTSAKIVEVYPSLKDEWSQSAFMGVAAKNPLVFLDAALESSHPSNFSDLVKQLAAQIGDKQDPAETARLIILVASKKTVDDGLKQAVLMSLTCELRADVVPAPSPALQKAFGELLASPSDGLAMAALPLAAREDKNGELTSGIKPLLQKLSADLNNAAELDDQRAQAAATLFAARQLDPQIVPSVAAILGSSSSASLQRHVIESLGKLPDDSIGTLLVAAYPKLSSDLQDADLNQLLKRSDWTSALLDAVEAGKINLSALGPVALNRLRTHNDPAVAARANKIIDTVRGPEIKEKDTLIAKFTPIVTQPGDPVRGKQLFTQNCAVCHRFDGAGNTVAPDLTGMGAHGPAELIIHVLDPNREVEPNYYAYSVETRDGESYTGVISRENSQSLTLRNASGDVEIKIADIKSRRNTGLSLMPNGFEALGGETLRDILAYLCAGDANYRIIDLHSAFTANSSRGMWLAADNPNDRLDFRKFGIVKVDDIPFEIVNPQKAANGRNVIVLKGGYGDAKAQPQRVEIPNVNVKATRLDFLGGIAGWGYPIGGAANMNLPGAKITVHYADGQQEEFILRNGVEIADWNGAENVPGSKFVPGLVRHGQVRWFTEPLKHAAVIQSLTLESFDNIVSPTFVAITAETGGAAQVAQEPPLKWGTGTRVLIVGGGASHDFNRWFNEADVATLTAAKNSVNYTDQIGDVLPALKDISVLYLCNNQPMTDPQLRKAIFDFADSGHGLLLVHPSVWYNWKDWPEYNRTLVGGGANGHDKYGEFDVTVTAPDHPVMAGVPRDFKITDELYHFEIDPKGTPIEVLAEGKNSATGKSWPMVWIVKHPHARIVCIALGHDAKAHELPAYQTLLQNAAKWAAESK